MKTKLLLRSALCAAVSAAVALPAYSLQLEEVTVTARKKEESIQDVPVAVTAITGMDLEQAFTLDTTGLQAFAPNVVFDTIEMGTPGGGGFSIRGISYQDVDKGFDPTVLVSVDDVPLATGTGQVFDMIDIERIEVLRGPQGTLFGKNVVGGLINIHRVKPQLDETSGKLRARYGEYEKVQGDFLYNYGEESWAIKVTGGVSEQGEGYVDNTEGGDLWYRDTQRFGAHLLWQPNDVITAEVMYDYSNLEGDPGTVFNVSSAADTFCNVGSFYGVADQGCSPVGGESSTGSRDRGSLDGEQWNELEKHQFTARLTANVTDDHTLTYVGSLMKSEDDQSLDGDGQALPIYHFRRWGDFDQFTHELRLSRDTGSNLTWQVGIFSAYAEGTNNQATRVLFPPRSGEFGRTTSDSYSAFGEADLALLDDKLVLTAGLRYIHETKKLARAAWANIDDPSTINLGPNAGGSTSNSKNIYRLGARYHFTDDVMMYFTTSTGFRSGGLSPRALDPEYLSQGYKPEELTNYEIGLRTTLFDGSLNFNLTAFQMDYEDMQVELAIPATIAPFTQNFVVNAGQASIQGLELDFNWLINDWWRLSGNVGTLDSEYDELFVNLYGISPSTGLPYSTRDESGLELRRSPELSYGLASTMNWEVGGGSLTWRLSYSWTDEYEATTTNYPGSGVEETGMVDSSLSFALEQWQFSLFGRNLTDDDSWTHNYVVNGTRLDVEGDSALWRFAQRRPPREIGMEVLYKF